MKSQSVSPIVSLFVATFFAIAVTILPSQAAAQCAAPTTSGIHICQPSANSVISGAPHIESAAEPSSGSITSMTVTVDGHQIFTNAGPEVDLFPGGIANGTHHMVITAHDNFGHTYQASRDIRRHR